MIEQQYCPICFQPMKQDEDNPFIWRCFAYHWNESGVVIDLTPKHTKEPQKND